MLHRALVAATLIGLAQPAEAESRRVRLDVPPDLAPEVSAMPPIAAPADEAERTINAALKRLDTKVRKAARECRADGGKNASWARHIEVPMRGPGFISYVVTDSYYCGGAHPSSGTMAIVYDLATGSPVDWTRLLPPALTGTVALAEQAEGSKVVTLASRRLYALYLERYRPKTGNAKIDESDADCREAVKEAGSGEPPAMIAWLDVKEGGLALQFDLAHAVQACADPIVIPVAVLRKDGVQGSLVDAIEAAQAKR